MDDPSRIIWMEKDPVTLKSAAVHVLDSIYCLILQSFKVLHANMFYELLYLK